MKRIILLLTFLVLTADAKAAPGASISIVIVTERGVQSTAPREWLQLLTRIGQRDVSIRSIRAGEQPDVDNTGTVDRPRYRVVGVLDSRGTLTVPGGRFDSRNHRKLADYFDRLASDGIDGVTAKRGRYGLTEKQFEAVFAELSQPAEIQAEGRSLTEVLNDVGDLLELELLIDEKAHAVIGRSESATEEVSDLTLGTALAILLRRDGLVLVPQKKRSEEVALRIARLVDVTPNDEDTTARGNRDEALADICWPVGWKSDAQKRQLAPAMMEYLNAEIEGFTLAEAMETIDPRTGIPIYWDHATLRKHQIDPTTLQVKYPKKRSQLIRVIDRLLFQARLRGELKVDEAGTVFYWISR